uniref:WW domain-containing protein n=1 Tax=Chrysotila carterae TaxID=13221 RepID=A0A7S4B3A4_CHRCT
MAEEASLPPNWEEVHDPEGRSYWWNVETNETTWMRPTNVVAKKSIAAGYLAKVQEAEKQVASPKVLKSSVKKDLPPVISTGTGVASLTKKFASCTTDSAPSGSGCGSPAAAARLSDSAATSAGGAPLCHLCPPPPPSSPETASVPLSACLADAPCAHTGRCLDLPYGRARIPLHRFQFTLAF